MPSGHLPQISGSKSSKNKTSSITLHLVAGHAPLHNYYVQYVQLLACPPFCRCEATEKKCFPKHLLTDFGLHIFGNIRVDKLLRLEVDTDNNVVQCHLYLNHFGTMKKSYHHPIAPCLPMTITNHCGVLPLARAAVQVSGRVLMKGA